MIRHRIFECIASRLARKSPDRMAAMLARLAQQYIHRRDAETGLRMLLDLDGRLYNLQNEAAVRWGDGTHPKHRLMAYHRFFTERVGADEVALDVGCGQGELAWSIANATGARVVGIDRKPESLAHARRRYQHENLEFVEGDATRTLPLDRCDVVVLSNVLEHIADRETFLCEVIQRTGAKRYLIRVPVIERDWRVPLKRELGLEYRLDHEHELEYTRETFEAELAKAGLEIVYSETRWGEIWCEARPTGET